MPSQRLIINLLKEIKIAQYNFWMKTPVSYWNVQVCSFFVPGFCFCCITYFLLKLQKEHTHTHTSFVGKIHFSCLGDVLATSIFLLCFIYLICYFHQKLVFRHYCQSEVAFRSHGIQSNILDQQLTFFINTHLNYYLQLKQIADISEC